MYQKVTTIRFKMLRHWLAGPFILGMVFPVALLDLCLEIYQHVTFPLYGIPIVERSSYIRLNRIKLSYLNTLDKMWCSYCQYSNGLMAYGVRIAGDTEKYWCAIKNRDEEGYVPQEHQQDFLDYGDQDAFDNFVNQK